MAIDIPRLPAWKLTEEDVVHAEWFERDRASVILYVRSEEDASSYEGATIAEFWDDDLRGLQEDGFLKASDWKGSAFAYAKEIGAPSISEIEASVAAASGRIWNTLMTWSLTADEDMVDRMLDQEEVDRLPIYFGVDIRKDFSSLPFSLKRTAFEEMRSILEQRQEPAPSI